ncbi:MAG: InlB B-repeat-containing protein [Oscillospiraceae bacterium]|nr:InlB B-repeat-containing protein [Oscillospiraceae bacterium]
MLQKTKRCIAILLAMVLTLGVMASGLFGTNVKAAAVGDVSVTAIATGKHHTLALDSTGHVWSWGQNYFGQLGLGYRTTGEDINNVTTPQLISGLSDVEAIAASYNSHSLALTSNGTLYAWGYNYYGQLGMGTTASATPIMTPTAVKSSYFDGKITAIAAGYNFSMAITEKGTLYTWGINTYGELGNNSYTFTGVPQKISMSENVTAISAGWESAMVLTESGKVYVCGYGGYGEMGDGTYTVYNKQFKQVTGVYSAKDPVVQISNDGYHMLALTQNGTLWSWGKGDRGELGNGARVHKNTPQNITSLVPLQSGESIVQIDAGYEDMAVLTSTGRLLACGTSMYGALGIGGDFSAVGEQSTLMQIFSAPDVTSEIVNGGAGYWKRFIIGDDGTMYATGYNFYGSLGADTISHGIYKGTTVYTELNFPFTSTYCTVNFDKNADDAVGTMNAQIELKNTTATLNKNEFSRPGYTFGGWSTTATGSAQYQDQGSMKFSTDTTLYAVWTYDPSQWATVSYDANGGTGSSSETFLLGDYVVKSADAAGIVAPAGYTHVGWNTAANQSGQQYSVGDTISFAQSQDLTLYASWEYTAGNYLTVTYDTNGGQGGTVVNGIVPNASHTVYSVTAADVSRPSWTFTGWNTAADGSGTSYQAGDTLSVTSNVTLYAQWEYVGTYVNVTYVTVDGVGGGSDGNYPTGSTYTIKTASEMGISLASFTFQYWVDINTGDTYYAGDQVVLSANLMLAPIFA